MNACPNCQQPVTNRSGFCPNCGSNYHIQKKKPKGLIWIMIGSLLAAALFITHGQIKDRTGAYSTIYEFEKIMSQKDARAALTLFKPQFQNVSSSENVMEEFLDYVDNEADWKPAVKEWKKSALRERERYDAIDSLNGDRLFTLEETGKFLGIYPTFEVIIHPFSLHVASYVDDTKVSFNKKSKALKNSEDFQKIGSFLPSYSDLEIDYSVKSKYADIEDSILFSSSTEEPNKVYVELPIEAASITVYSNEDDAIVYINGESTKKTVSEIGEIGPLPTDGSISVHAELEDRVSYAEDVYSGGEYELWFDEEYVYEDYAEEEEEEEVYTENADDVVVPTEEELEDLYTSFQNAAVEAINARDFTIVDYYYHPDGVSGPESASYIDYLDSKGITEQLIGCELVDYEVTDEGIVLHTFESYMISSPDKLDVQKSFNTEHLLVSDDGDWKFYQLLATTEIE